MRSLLNVGWMAALVLSGAYGCVEEGTTQNGAQGETPDRDAAVGEDGRDDGDDDDGDDGDGDPRDGGAVADAGRADPDAAGGDDGGIDSGMEPAPNRPPDEEPPGDPGPSPTPKTEVPAELIGAWQSSPIDFELWENYREGYYAGRNAVASREAMIFYEGGDAKFYRYEFAFTAYEELIDCEGTVAFHDDGTFTFHPVTGRKRFYDSSDDEHDTERALTAEELLDPELAGTRAYSYEAGEPARLLITVPSSAPYYWYPKP